VTALLGEAPGAGMQPTSPQPSLTTMSDAQTARAIQILTTEHFTLQGARANTVSETNRRIAIFLGMVSSTLIALAFVGQISSLGLAFQVFTLILLPTVLFLGVATFGRVLESSIEDYFYLGGINRIHHFYAEVVPTLSCPRMTIGGAACGAWASHPRAGRSFSLRRLLLA
jgi:hypothetical protein